MKKIFKAFLLTLALVTISAAACASPENPTDSEVLAAYNTALPVFEWFDIKPLPTNGEEKKELGFMIYYNVTDPKIKSMDSLHSALDKVFTSTFSSMLITSRNMYREFNGTLYVAPAGRKVNKYAGNTTFKVTQRTADKIVLQASTEIFGKDLKTVATHKTQNFDYVKTPSGWRFATFEAVK